jgi:hypothetical protein
MHRWLFRHRRWTLVPAGACFIITAGLAWAIFGRPSPSAETNPFAELDIELGQPSAPVPLQTGEATNEMTLRLPTDNDQSATTMTAHFTNGPAAPAPIAPVWLVGTIEPLDDHAPPAVPPWEVRQAANYDSTQR